MRIALVSPYSWSYPGGVTRHIEALAEQFMASGHHVRVLSPYDPPDRLSARMHRGARPEARELQDWVIPLGRTIGVKSNGAVSNLPHTPYAITTMRRELRAGRFDVIHVHEPVAPVVGYDALDTQLAPLVGTFHCYSENAVSNSIGNAFGAKRKLQRLHVRIAVSEAAAWTGRRFYGGGYRIIPNGVDVPAELPRARAAAGRARRCASRSSARPSSARGCPSCCAPSRRCATTSTSSSCRRRRPRRGRAADARRHAGRHTCWARSPTPRRRTALASADLLVAPSLGGESFGMVLTEAFAAGTPVVASDIPGYRDVVRDGVDGVLVPRGDATALAETLRDLAVAPERRAAMAVEARAQRAALRLADGRRRGPRGLHRRRRHAAGRHRAPARRRVPRRRPGRSRAAPAGRAAPAQPRGLQARGPRPPPRGRPQGRHRPGRPGRRRSSPCSRCSASGWTRSATAC